MDTTYSTSIASLTGWNCAPHTPAMISSELLHMANLIRKNSNSATKGVIFEQECDLSLMSPWKILGGDWMPNQPEGPCKKMTNILAGERR